MKTLVLEEPGELPTLVVREIAEPRAAPGQVVLRVLACGLCHHDVLVMRGVLRRGVKSGVVLGHEIAGEVVEVGPEVEGLQLGDRVVTLQTNACGHCQRCNSGRQHRCLNGSGIGHGADGGLAEYVAVSAQSVVPFPPQVPPEEACLLGCPIGVALRALVDVAQLQGDETALVTGASGGLGVHGVQLAQTLGAQVFAVTSSPEKVSPLEELGVHHVLLHEDLDFARQVRALTEDSGVDVVLETVGAPTFVSSLRSLATGGRLAVVGEVSGEQVPLSLAELIFRDARVVGSSGADRRHLEEAVRLVERGHLHPVIDRTLPLERVLEGYHLLRQRQAFGRVVIVPQ